MHLGRRLTYGYFHFLYYRSCYDFSYRVSLLFYFWQRAIIIIDQNSAFIHHLCIYWKTNTLFEGLWLHWCIFRYSCQRQQILKHTTFLNPWKHGLSVLSRQHAMNTVRWGLKFWAVQVTVSRKFFIPLWYDIEWKHTLWHQNMFV